MVTELIAEVRRLAAAMPDFVYCNFASGECSNLDGGDINYPDHCGCIIGQAWRNVGGPDLSQYPTETITTLLVEEFPYLEPTLSQVKWLQAVQCKQDQHWTWCSAVSWADSECPL